MAIINRVSEILSGSFAERYDQRPSQASSVMTQMLKVFKTGFGNFWLNLANGDGMRITGDCSNHADVINTFGSQAN